MSQWELLVTEGHVRAARWRNAFPVLLIAAIAAIALGVALLRSLPEFQSSTKVAEAKTAYAVAQRSAVSAFLQNREAALSTPPEGIADAPTPEALGQSLQAILGALQQDDELPDSITAQDAEAFWRGDWGANAVHAVENGRTILVGAYVNAAYQMPGYDTPPDLRRGFWIIRKPEQSWIWRDSDGPGWELHCLRVAGALACGDDTVDPIAIPDTMRGLVPSSAFAAQP